jgi:hypothetical protein
MSEARHAFVICGITGNLAREPTFRTPYDQRSWGPAQANRLAEKVGGWQGPWIEAPA